MELQRDLTEEQVKILSEQCAEVVIDTETTGLEKNRDRICLIQLHARPKQSLSLNVPYQQPRCSTDDPASDIPEFLTIFVRVDGRTSTELPRNLLWLLTCEHITKVFHYARYDCKMLQELFKGIQVAPLACTKVASKLARTWSDKHGLGTLEQELLGIKRDKSLYSFYWGNEVIPPEQLEYAAKDVETPLDILHELLKILDNEDRLFLYWEYMKALPTLIAGEVEGFDPLVVLAH